MIDSDDIYEIDKFVSDLHTRFKKVKHFSSFLRLEKGEKKDVEKALEVLGNKISKMKKSENIKEIKKYLKIKKILDR